VVDAHSSLPQTRKLSTSRGPRYLQDNLTLDAGFPERLGAFIGREWRLWATLWVRADVVEENALLVEQNVILMEQRESDIKSPFRIQEKLDAIHVSHPDTASEADAVQAAGV
jgi:hypothetical protein